MNRRRFVGALGTGILTDPSAAWSAPLTVHYRRTPPYEAYRRYLEGVAREPVPTPRAPAAGTPWFRDVTAGAFTKTPEAREHLSRGVPSWAAALDPATGIDIYGNNGIAVGDIDGDGVDEIYVCQPGGLPNRLLKWTNGELEDLTATAGVGLLDNTSCALFLDLRNLGRQDLVVLRSAGPVLFLNDGSGKFTLRKDAFDFARPARGSFTGMAAADYDRDGRLDLYLCCYSFFQSEAQYLYPAPYHDAQNGPPNFLFHNRLAPDGAGAFADVTQSTGIDRNNNRFSFAPAWCDYDGSGWPSLYVANDFGRNNLYKNDRGRFRDAAREAGVEDMGPGMSACWFDENGDGRPDLYVANMWTAAGRQVVTSPDFPNAKTPELKEAYRRHTKGNSLYTNLGNGRFTETGAQRGVEMGRWGWSATAHDFDGDTRPEIYAACGMLTGHRQPDLMSFFWQHVVAQSPVVAAPAAKYESGWNAINQFIREGYSWNGHEPNVFYTRDGEGYRDASVESGLDIAADTRAFAVTDIDGDGSPDLLLKNRLGPQLQVLQNARGQRSQWLVLALQGVESNRDAIGAKVAVDGQTQWLAAGSGYLSQHSKRLHFGLGSEKRRATRVIVTWPSGKVQEVGALEGGFVYRIKEGQPATRAHALAVPRPWPAGLLPGDNSQDLRDTRFVEPLPLPEPHAGPGVLVLGAGDLQDPDRAAAWSLFRRYLFEYRAELELPLALQLDERGRALGIHSKPPVGDRPAPLPKAIRYPGISVDAPRRDFFKLGLALLWSGYGEQALPYLEAALRQQPDNARVLGLVSQIHLEANRLDEAQRAAESAVKSDPSYAEGWNGLGGVAAARADFDTALRHYQRAISIKEDLTHTLLNAGQAAAKLERWTDSAAFYRRALTADAASADAANGYGFALAHQNKPAEAKTYLQRAIELKPDFGAAINNLAVLYLQQGQMNDAVAALRYGIKVAPAEEILYLNLGRAYVQSGDRDQAREVMRALLAVKPDSPVAQRALRDLER